LAGRIPAFFASNLAFPYHLHLKSSTSQWLREDMEILAAIFPVEGVIVGFGKISASAAVRADIDKV
jgi:hypothetical protein